MHFLFVNRHYGGEQVPTGRMLNDLVSALLEKGHEVTILTTKTSYKDTAGSEMKGNQKAKIIYLPTLGDWSRLIIWGLFWLQSNTLVPFLKWDRCIVLTDPPFLITTAIFCNIFSNKRSHNINLTRVHGIKTNIINRRFKWFIFSYPF